MLKLNNFNSDLNNAYKLLFSTVSPDTFEISNVIYKILPYVIDYEIKIYTKDDTRRAVARVNLNHHLVKSIDFVMSENKIFYYFIYHDSNDSQKSEFSRIELLHLLEDNDFYVDGDSISNEISKHLMSIQTFEVSEDFKNICLAIVNRILYKYDELPVTYSITRCPDMYWTVFLVYPKLNLKFDLHYGVIYYGNDEKFAFCYPQDFKEVDEFITKISSYF